MSIELVMPSNYLILCRPLLLLPSIFLSIRVLSSELDLQGLLLMSSTGRGTSYSCTTSQLQTQLQTQLCDTGQDPADSSQLVSCWAWPTEGARAMRSDHLQWLEEWVQSGRKRCPFFFPGGLLSMCSSRSACMGPGSPHLSGPHEQASGSIFWQVSMPPSRMPVPLRTGQALDRDLKHSLDGEGDRLLGISESFPCSLTLNPSRSSCFTGVATSGPPRDLTPFQLNLLTRWQFFALLLLFSC